MDSDGYLSQLADIFNGITVNTPSISAIIAIVLAGVLLLASGFASASEIAFSRYLLLIGMILMSAIILPTIK